MLVLSRKAGERIHIGDDIVVTITQCGRGRVTVGIDAPRDVGILRSEKLNDAPQPEIGQPAQSVNHCVAAKSV